MQGNKYNNNVARISGMTSVSLKSAFTSATPSTSDQGKITFGNNINATLDTETILLPPVFYIRMTFAATYTTFNELKYLTFNTTPVFSGGDQTHGTITADRWTCNKAGLYALDYDSTTTDGLVLQGSSYVFYHYKSDGTVIKAYTSSANYMLIYFNATDYINARARSTTITTSDASGTLTTTITIIRHA